MCDGVVPADSSWSTSGDQESVDAHVDAHSQHVVFDLVSWCGPFRHTLLRHHESPIILTRGPKLRPDISIAWEDEENSLAQEVREFRWPPPDRKGRPRAARRSEGIGRRISARKWMNAPHPPQTWGGSVIYIEPIHLLYIGTPCQRRCSDGRSRSAKAVRVWPSFSSSASASGTATRSLCQSAAARTAGSRSQRGTSTRRSTRSRPKATSRAHGARSSPACPRGNTTASPLAAGSTGPCSWRNGRNTPARLHDCWKENDTMQMTTEARTWLDSTVRRILARHPLGDAERTGITYELMSHLHAAGEARATAAGRREVAREDLEAALLEAGGENGLAAAFVEPLVKPVERVLFGRRLV